MKNFEISEAGLFDSKMKFMVKEGVITPLRKLTEYEIEYFCEDGGITFLNGSEYPVKKGHILIGKPGQMRQSKLHFRVYYIHLNVFSEEIIDVLNSLPDVLEITADKEYMKIFQNFTKASLNNFEGKDFFLASALYELIYMLSSEKKRLKNEPSPLTDKKLITKAIKFIEEHYEDAISLSDIANSVNLSPVYFHVVFKSYTGKTPHDFLQETRLLHSKNMLTSTSLSISEIALACGFSSQSYFNAFFKKRLNTTPLKYRKAELDRYGI